MTEPVAIELADEAKDALLATEDPWMPELPALLPLSRRHSPERRSCRMISSIMWNYLRLRIPGIQRTVRPTFWVPQFDCPFHVRVHKLGSGFSKCHDGFDTRELQTILRHTAQAAERLEITHFHSAWLLVRFVNRDGSFGYCANMRAARVPQPRYD